MNDSAPDGYVIQVGDSIEMKNAFRTTRHIVHRVTRTLAFVRYNEFAEGKFPRVFGFGFGMKPYQRFDTNHYRVIRREKAAPSP